MPKVDLDQSALMATWRPAQAYGASEVRTLDLTAEGCGAVTMQGLGELMEQYPGVEALFTKAVNYPTPIPRMTV